MAINRNNDMHKHIKEKDILKFSNGRTSKIFYIHNSTGNAEQCDLQELADMIESIMRDSRKH